MICIIIVATAQLTVEIKKPVGEKLGKLIN